MARAFTAGQRSAITGPDCDIYAKLELRDYDGDWTDVSTGLGGGTLNWLTDITLDEDIDANSMILNATLLRDNASTLSLSPLRTDSTLNRDNLNNYQPFLDIARQWRVSVAVVADGVAPIAGDYKEIGGGVYDVIDIQSPSPTIQIMGRDWGASLLDRWIDVKRTYGDDTNPIAMETVIQQMLDDFLGASAITLYTPVSPSFVMKKWEQQPMSLMQAINDVAHKAGFVCKYRYDASDVFRLTLYSPSRTATPGSEVWTLGPAEYLALPTARLDVATVRNKIIVYYDSDSTGKVESVTSSNATSITRYGGPHSIPRIMEVDLSRDTNIRTSARAQAFADAVRSDLDTPAMEQQFETPGFWIAQLGDYGKFTQNGVHYDTDQYGGVTHIRHRIYGGTMRTTLNVRGQPAGRYKTWVADDRIRGVPELRIRNFREISRTTTDITYGWDIEGYANEQWLWLNTYAQPIATDPWPNLSSTPNFRLTAVTQSYTVTIPAVGYTTYGQLLPVDQNAQIGKAWQFTVQGDALRLVQRATIVSTSSTQIVVRVAVANPLAGGDVTITYAAGGLTVSPASPQAILAASITDDITTTGSVDFTITRPSFQAGTGRVTFTASSTDRTTDVDAVDVPAQERDTQPVQVRVLRVSETTDQIVVRVEAITPNAGATVTVTYNAGGLTVAPASGGTFTSTTSFGTTNHIDYTITRDTQGGTPRRVTFTCSATGFLDGTDGVDVGPTSTRFRCRLTNSGTTATTNNTFTQVPWDTETYDTGGLHAASPNPSRITIPTGGNTGVWLIYAQLSWTANATGLRQVVIYKNGVITESRSLIQAVADGVNTTVHSALLVEDAPAVNDYYETYGLQVSGGNLNITAGNSFMTATHLW